MSELVWSSTSARSDDSLLLVVIELFRLLLVLFSVLFKFSIVCLLDVNESDKAEERFDTWLDISLLSFFGSENDGPFSTYNCQIDI